jgi:acyl-coenzyme A thioesterase PaaI-like protein
VKEIHPFPFAEARRTFTADEYSSDRILIRYFLEDDGRLLAQVRFGPRSEGAPGFVHGGGLLTVLDEAMGAACWQRGWTVMTVRLSTTFRLPVPVGAELTAETEILRDRRRTVDVAGRLVDRGGRVYVEAEGSFARLPPDRLKAIFGRPSA